jgi:hypothetical protein
MRNVNLFKHFFWLIGWCRVFFSMRGTPFKFKYLFYYAFKIRATRSSMHLKFGGTRSATHSFKLLRVVQYFSRYFRYSTTPLGVKSHTFQAHKKLRRLGYAREFNTHKSIGPTLFYYRPSHTIQ